ncbi:unnamed protein product [Pelagomonas calceolata]|uniref:Uncharacterized protein n=1 Tax=Pelagomonas calceolata TaxID=35677 RepID=A0A8J2WR00_9STRA|nr:unnamed protein product [Pelagomonas calceolata]
MGAGASAGALPDTVTLDEAKAYAGDAWTDDAQKAFDASASNGTTTKEAIAAYEQEQRRAATKLQASIRGQQERKNPTPPPEKTKANVGKEQFVASLMTLVALAVDGLPKGFRSTKARRNKLLRNFAGDADRCCGQAFATTMSEDTVQFLVAFVPGLGACSAIIAPLWKLLRGTLLVCALRGHDLSLPQTRARVLYAMAGTKAEAVAAGAMSTVVETAAQALFVYLCSGVPGASMLPVGAAVSSLVDTEAAVAGKAGLADFRDGSRTIELAEYSEELDPEPSMADRAALAQEMAQKGARAAFDAARDPAKRKAAAQAAVGGAVSTASAAASQASALMGFGKKPT